MICSECGWDLGPGAKWCVDCEHERVSFSRVEEDISEMDTYVSNDGEGVILDDVELSLIYKRGN